MSRAGNASVATQEEGKQVARDQTSGPDPSHPARAGDSARRAVRRFGSAADSVLHVGEYRDMWFTDLKYTAQTSEQTVRYYARTKKAGKHIFGLRSGVIRRR